jgi:hypothetical protein
MSKPNKLGCSHPHESEQFKQLNRGFHQFTEFGEALCVLHGLVGGQEEVANSLNNLRS